MKQLGGGGITIEIIQDSVTLCIEGKYFMGDPAQSILINSRCSLTEKTAYSDYEVVWPQSHGQA